MQANKQVSALNNMATAMKHVTSEAVAISKVGEALRATGAKTTDELVKKPQEKEAFIKVLEAFQPQVFKSETDMKKAKEALEKMKKEVDPNAFATQL